MQITQSPLGNNIHPLGVISFLSHPDRMLLRKESHSLNSRSNFISPIQTKPPLVTSSKFFLSGEHESSIQPLIGWDSWENHDINSDFALLESDSFDSIALSENTNINSSKSVEDRTLEILPSRVDNNTSNDISTEPNIKGKSKSQKINKSQQPLEKKSKSRTKKAAKSSVAKNAEQFVQASNVTINCNEDTLLAASDESLSVEANSETPTLQLDIASESTTKDNNYVNNLMPIITALGSPIVEEKSALIKNIANDASQLNSELQSSFTSADSSVTKSILPSEEKIELDNNKSGLVEDSPKEFPLYKKKEEIFTSSSNFNNKVIPEAPKIANISDIPVSPTSSKQDIETSRTAYIVDNKTTVSQTNLIQAKEVSPSVTSPLQEKEAPHTNSNFEVITAIEPSLISESIVNNFLRDNAVVDNSSTLSSALTSPDVDDVPTLLHPLANDENTVGGDSHVPLPDVAAPNSESSVAKSPIAIQQEIDSSVPSEFPASAPVQLTPNSADITATSPETAIAPLTATSPEIVETAIAPLTTTSPEIGETAIAPLTATSPEIGETVIAPLTATSPEISETAIAPKVSATSSEIGETAIAPLTATSLEIGETAIMPLTATSPEIGETAIAPLTATSPEISETAIAPKVSATSSEIGETAIAPLTATSLEIGETAIMPLTATSPEIGETAIAPLTATSPEIGETAIAPKITTTSPEIGKTPTIITTSPEIGETAIAPKVSATSSEIGETAIAPKVSATSSEIGETAIAPLTATSSEIGEEASIFRKIINNEQTVKSEFITAVTNPEISTFVDTSDNLISPQNEVSTSPEVEQNTTVENFPAPKGYATGSHVTDFHVENRQQIAPSDTVPAMPTPGEFVINTRDAQNNLPLLHHINTGGTPQDIILPSLQTLNPTEPEEETFPETPTKVDSFSDTSLQLKSAETHLPQVSNSLIPSSLGLDIGKQKLSILNSPQLNTLQNETSNVDEPLPQYSSPPLIFRKANPATNRPYQGSNTPSQWSSVEDLLNGNNDELTSFNFSGVESNSQNSEFSYVSESPQVFAKHLPTLRGFANGKEVTLPDISRDIEPVTEMIENTYSSSKEDDKDDTADLEALAREIYSRLRQRIEIERERHGGHSGRLPW
ncbi:hypothetical protein LC607_20795 [Nostoc sp. CHAB 5824]|nr:hypothetical protein [Nostoc sp. CHAB 5824]